MRCIDAPGPPLPQEICLLVDGGDIRSQAFLRPSRQISRQGSQSQNAAGRATRIEEALEAYRVARAALVAAIRREKARAPPPGSSVVCYADDTLVLAGGQTCGEAIIRAEIALESVVRSIGNLGLKVAARKTETVVFRGARTGPPPPTLIRVGEVHVQVGGKIKYLGLQLDATWSFGEHFRCLAPRVGVAMALCRLLPNLGGPGGRVRQIYAAVVSSVALYGAPVWADDVAATRRLRDLLRRLQRRMAIRAARGYRTISHAAATVLTGMPPLDLAARMYSNMYRRVRGIRDNGAEIIGRIRRVIKDQARRSMVLEWQRSLEDPHIAGKRTVEAIRPFLPEWIERVKREGITYRMTQMLTGHGCFGEYMCRIGKERTAECHHCDHPHDSAQHTLESCPAWVAERANLVTPIKLAPPAQNKF